MHKFFVSEEAVTDGIITLSGDDAHHISFSLRMKTGDKIKASTPDGIEHLCSLTDFSGETVTAKIENSERSSSESPCVITLFQALPKGDKLETVIQKAVECGASLIVPFQSRFCISKPKDCEKKLDRWNRIALEAAKQCGRGIVPKVMLPLSYSDAVSMAAGSELSVFCYENERSRLLGDVLREGDPKSISVMVGPEGGFSSDEVSFAEEKGLTVTGLGKRILRCETAPIFVLSAISLIKELISK